MLLSTYELDEDKADFEYTGYGYLSLLWRLDDW